MKRKNQASDYYGRKDEESVDVDWGIGWENPCETEEDRADRDEDEESLIEYGMNH